MNLSRLSLPRVLAVAALASSLLSARAFAAGAEPITLGTVTNIQSKVLGEERSILVSTPRGYDQGGARYPVLYHTDGEAQFLHTVATVDFLTRAGRISPLIVVGILNRNGDRTRDLTPTRSSLTRPNGALSFPTSGGGDRFLSFLETEVIPLVESSYRTLPYRILAGHSFGGLFALHTFAKKPDLFGGVIAVSPTLDWDQELALRETRDLLAAKKDLRATLYVTLGNEGADLDKLFKELEKTLGRAKSKSFAWGTMSFPDEDHGSVVLLSHYRGLLKIYEGWQMPQEAGSVGPKGGLPGVKAHFAKLSERFGYKILPAEGVVNLAGYAELQAKRYERALEAFRFNVESYPESANVHDSLGEGLEASGDFAGAKAAYAKAVELGRKTADPNLAIFEQHLAGAGAKAGTR